ncbi:MAG TPA: hypothetical protein VMD29_05345 [Terracidiphilus sp.]|nr:hypothetical protein [Terracidiphilus sp.]
MSYARPSSRLRKLLLTTASHLERTPGLSPDDIAWLRNYATYLMLEAAADEEVSALSATEAAPRDTARRAGLPWQFSRLS